MEEFIESSPPVNQVLQVQGVQAWVGPLALQVYAADFLRAAEAAPPVAGRFSPVSFYLLGHAIELSLKAFLRLRGVPVARLRQRDFGHNLDALLAESESLGMDSVVPLTVDQKDAIKQCNEYYHAKLLEYLDDITGLFEALSGYPKRPPLEPLLEAARLLVTALEGPCLNAVAPRGS